jgi:hypothetical protein
MKTPSGNVELFKKPMLADVPRGSQIYTAAETQRMLAEGMYNRSLDLAYKQLMESGNKEKAAVAEMSTLNLNVDSPSVVKAIKELPVHETYFNEGGVSKFIRRRNSRTLRLNAKNTL